MRLAIKNVTLLAMKGNEELPLNNMSIVIKDNIIEKICKDSDLKIQEDMEVFNGKDLLLMPGLINTHTHVGMSLFRGYNDDKDLMDWLNNVILPKEKLLTKEDIYWCTLLSCIEMIKTGTTCFADMYFECREISKAVSELGMRAILSWSVCDDNVDCILQQEKEYIAKFNDENNLINLGLSLHSPYACNKETIKKVKDLINEKQKVLQIHLAETKAEVDIIKKKYNKTPTEYLYEQGLLNSNTLLAHGIYLNENDIDILKDCGSSISHNPISNCKLASGICDVTTLRKSGINVGLGTDGHGSTTTLDLFEEMRVAGYLQKLKYSDPTIIKAYNIIKMATLEGARALKLDNEIGSIEEGKCADLVFIDLNTINLQPNNDICSNLVYSATGENVKHVMINGQFVMKNKKLLNIDEEKIIEKVRQIAKNIL